ncbi:MAG TPA: 1-deoxy-D-xylulose-5-phosphate synthase [Anaerolineae bacterium]|nr:1-deoxy-D-xylulose-5-phosphate synthase [Anaerolineae bacterium]HQH38954.1 1-deoxy-D-xylulose-5-phosphate synthase [Anaerolineae bacterium]
MTQLLDQIKKPEDLKHLERPALEQIAAEIRQHIITTVLEKGGHMASNLGVVELTIALHIVFDSPRDKLIWDVSHQCYAHKLLTGRLHDFATLRQYDGLSGYSEPRESVHDVITAGHVGTSISTALGIATARDLQGEDFHVVAIIGDGSITAGMTLEGFNHAGYLQKRFIVVLNDNEMSISPSVGAIANQLNTAPATSPALWEALGFHYIGPVDGHDLDALQTQLRAAKAIVDRPVVVHVRTQKGKGYRPAEADPEKWHGVAPKTTPKTNAPTYSQVFGDTVTAMARADKRVVAITAAMPSGTGLSGFARTFPERFFDVGIAEQHAVTFAAGLAVQGMRPVAAIYSSFLQRAYDQLIHDVALQNLPVIFAIDRGGIVGDDGRTHQGVFDLAYLRSIPNFTVMAPKDEAELVEMLWTALTINGPVAIRYPRGAGEGVTLPTRPQTLPVGRAEMLRAGADLAILAVGPMVYPALEAAQALSSRGVEAAVINARFVKPLDGDLLKSLALDFNRLVTVEEGVLAGGFGSAVLEMLETRGLNRVTLKRLGVPDEFVEHGERRIFLKRYNLDAAGIVSVIQHTFPELFSALWYYNAELPGSRALAGMPGFEAGVRPSLLDRGITG